jgi:hypothetical protein
VAESLSLVPKLLVALKLVGSGLGNSGLSSDALAELVDFAGESDGLSFKSCDVGIESFLLVVERLDGLGVELSELVVGLLNLGSEGLDELGDALKG